MVTRKQLPEMPELARKATLLQVVCVCVRARVYVCVCVCVELEVGFTTSYSPETYAPTPTHPPTHTHAPADAA